MSQPQRRGRPTGSTVNQNAVTERSARRWIADKHPIEKSEVDSLVGYLRKRPNSDWSAEDEAKVKRKREASDMKVARGILEQTSRPYLLNLWKIWLRLRRSSPVSVISPMYQLRYLPAEMTTNERGYDYLY
ncbi:hypothetical protein FPOA_07028 [Fusarium poae]|uniref:Uncharacterized protein n=1 Tax=Fusarium poae TaxID=36050 RepID=A0A1B8AJE0_FUSPO|nr:hypothetical protein FPOA_07028 [Fusarium poae]